MTDQAKRLKKLIEAGQALAGALALKDLLPRLLKLAQEVTDAEASSILLYQPETDTLRFELALNETLDGDGLEYLEKTMEIPVGTGIAGWVAKHRESLNIPDASQDDRFFGVVDQKTGFVTRNIMCAPIVSGQDLLGVVQVLNARNRQDFKDTDMELLETFGDLAAVALERSKMRRALYGNQVLSSDSCWKSVGYLGDKSCPELERHVHCHNCPVFSDAGHSLFDREPPEGYVHEWTEVLSRKKEDLKASMASMAAFRLGDEWLGLSTTVFNGVFEVRPVRKIPHRSGPVLLGLTVVHGHIMPCLSVSRLMGLDTVEERASERNKFRSYERFLFVGRGDESYVFPVDEMRGIVRYYPGRTSKVPDTVAKSPASYTRSIVEHDGLSIGILDEELFFNALARSLK